MDKLFQFKSEKPGLLVKKPKKNILAAEASKATRPFGLAQRLEHINNSGKEGRGRPAK